MQSTVRLSEQTLQIITLASHGMAVREIAEELDLQYRIVDRRIVQALLITETRNTTELVAMALRQKWIR